MVMVKCRLDEAFDLQIPLCFGLFIHRLVGRDRFRVRMGLRWGM